MRAVVFRFSNGKVNGKVEEVVEFEDDMTDEEIQEHFNTWLYEKSNATWFFAKTTKMISVKVVTVMNFQSEEAFRRYLSDPVLNRVTGFRDELEEAWDSGQVVVSKTERVDYAAVCTTTVEVGK